MHIHPVTHSKTIPDSSLYPFSDQNGAKTLPFGAAHNYMAYIREFPWLLIIQAVETGGQMRHTDFSTESQRTSETYFSLLLFYSTVSFVLFIDKISILFQIWPYVKPFDEFMEIHLITATDSTFQYSPYDNLSPLPARIQNRMVAT